MKKIFQHSSNQDQKVNFIGLESLIFKEKNGIIYIGGQEINSQMRSILRDQAKNFQTTQLFEIIDATVINESFELANQANTLEHVQYYKALIYWNKILLKMINALAK